MFTLTVYQRYISDILEETGALRAGQVRRLLQKLDEKTDPAYAGRLIVQLRTINRAFLKTEDVITPPRLRDKDVDTEMLLAVNVMLDLLEGAPLAVSAGKPPFKLRFVIERGDEVMPFGVAAAEPGGETELCYRLGGADNGTTVVFLLTDLRQSEKIHTGLPHFFAVHDGEKLRYFKGGDP
jgi:hypothetical protein